MTAFSRLSQAFVIKATIGDPNVNPDFEVSTDGSIRIRTGFTVSAISGTTGTFSGTLTVGGKITGSAGMAVSQVASFTGGLVTGATIAAAGFLMPTVTVGANASAVNTLRFCEIIQTGGTKIFVPYVSALPN